MRAISLWQPWASAVALGAKRIETRSWATNYRGPLLIHAAKRCNKTQMRAIAAAQAWRNALGLLAPSDAPSAPWGHLPLGAVIAVCNLVDCKPVEAISPALLDAGNTRDGTFRLAEWTERMMGDYTPGRYGWVLEDVHALRAPVPKSGGQSFFDVPRTWVAEDLARWPGRSRFPQQLEVLRG